MQTLNELAAEIHADNEKWWTHPVTGQRIERNDGELFMLIVSEIAEGFEGAVGDTMDDKLPHREMVEVELADTQIRMLDYAGARKLDLEGAVARERRTFNPRGMYGSTSFMFMLMVGHVAAAMEGHRKGKEDAVVTEFARLWLRIEAAAEDRGFNLEAARNEKRAFNKTRIDHTHAARLAPGGKKY